MTNVTKTKKILQTALLFCHVLTADLPEETLYATWKDSPLKTVLLQWLSLSSDPTPRKVCYHKEGEPSKEVQATTFSIPNLSNYLLNKVEIEELTPATSYFLSLCPLQSTDDTPVLEYEFRTAPENLKNPLKFVVGGDVYHDGPASVEKTAKQAINTDPLFILLGGDISYAVKGSFQQPEKWVSWLKTWHGCVVTPNKRLIPTLAAVGNHDVVGEYDQTPAQAAIFNALFPLGTCNTVNFDQYLVIFLLDSGHARPIAGTQTEWLENALKANQKTTHRFAIYHVPAYPSVRHPRTRQSFAIRRHWVPLFEKWGLHAAFENHDHAYKRTHLLLGNNPNPQGILYIGDGAWGVDKPRKTRPYSYLAKTASARHCISVTLTETQQEFLAVDENGEVLDFFANPRLK